MSIPAISAPELAESLKTSRDTFLLDVRTHREIEIAHIEAAHHIPLHELELRLNEIPDDRRVVVICHHGIRSLHAAMYLKTEGFVDVWNLSGGIDDWSRRVDHSVPLY